MGNEGSKPKSNGVIKKESTNSIKSVRAFRGKRKNKDTKSSMGDTTQTHVHSRTIKNERLQPLPNHINGKETPDSHRANDLLVRRVSSQKPRIETTDYSENFRNDGNHDGQSMMYSSPSVTTSQRGLLESNSNSNSNSHARSRSHSHQNLVDGGNVAGEEETNNQWSNHGAHRSSSNVNLNDANNINNHNHRLPPSMAVLKPKSPILRMNSSTSINDNSIQHMNPIDRQRSNSENHSSHLNNLSRRNSSTTINSTNSKNSRHSKNSRNSRSYLETHGIPTDAFTQMTLEPNMGHLEDNGDQRPNSPTHSKGTSRSNSRSNSRSHSRSHSTSSRNRASLIDQLGNGNVLGDYSNAIEDSGDEGIQPSQMINTDFRGDLQHPNNEQDLLAYEQGENFIYGNNKDQNSQNQNYQEYEHEQAGQLEQNQNHQLEENIPTDHYINPNDYRRKYDLDIEEMIQRLLDAGYAYKRTKSVCLKNSEIAMICSVAREIFLSQPSLLELSAPVKIVGDVHGQYTDLIRIFSKCGFPPASNYLFLGDYVDRGKQSLETILLLLCYKIKFPENFFLLRGNHECAQITRQYGFYDECKRRTNLKTWKLFVDTFNTLPIAAIVASKIFCVHGGLSPVLNSMDEIRNIRRPTDVPDFGLLNDLLWSDPADSPNQWEDNERGVSYCFNKVAINNFLNKFQFDLVVRAHMVVEDGYEFFNDRSLVTVFSAPNYCGEFDNWGAVMGVSEELLCSFELLDPLDSVALKHLMKKGRIERRNAMLKYSNNSTNQPTK